MGDGTEVFEEGVNYGWWWVDGEEEAEWLLAGA